MLEGEGEGEGEREGVRGRGRGGGGEGGRAGGREGGRAVTFDELAPQPNGVALDLVAICNRNMDNLRECRTLCACGVKNANVSKVLLFCSKFPFTGTVGLN